MPQQLPPTRALVARGGAAGGDASRNPTASTYAATPPKSTYTGPKVAGTYGGFVGVFVGAGIFTLIVIAFLVFWRWRTLKRRERLGAAGDGAEDGGAGGGVRDWAAEHGDAFEMPSTLSSRRGEGGRGLYETPFSPSSSTVHLSPYAGQSGGGGGGDSPRLYAHEGAVSAETFFEGGNNAQARREEGGGSGGEYRDAEEGAGRRTSGERA
ncbi:hypothetical protein JCM6882_007678 [Rhodosporidiobolus microsporus]